MHAPSYLYYTTLQVELTLSVEELLPHSLRRKFIIGERTITPNRKLKLSEKIWYKVLKFRRFDDPETIINGLNPPSVCKYHYKWGLELIAKKKFH